MVPLVACVLFGAFQEEPDYGICAHYKMPVHGTVIPGGTLVGFFGDRPPVPFEDMSIIPRKQGTALMAVSGGQCNAHCRHHVAAERIWYFCGPERLCLAA